MSLSPSITEDDVFIALRAYLLGIVDPAVTEVFQAQNNRVPEPKGQSYIVMTPANRIRLATNTDGWDRTNVAPVEYVLQADTQFDMQLDIHGPKGSDIAQVIAATFADDYGRAVFDGTGVAPLYVNDGHQLPFVNGEQQYENRWVMTASMQISPTVSTPMQFAATLTPTVKPVFGG